MAKMKLNMKDLGVKDLQDLLQEKRQTYNKMKFTNQITPLENPKTILAGRREIARILTEIRKRELSNPKN